MQYLSTRGHPARSQFSEILLDGLAPDGGLYVPVSYPRVTEAELDSWRELSYADLAFEVLRRFATDIPEADIKALVARTYTPEVYCNHRAGEDPAQITPLRLLEHAEGTELQIQALSNGPTLAFKDMAMQLLGNLFEYTLYREGAELNILGATSGDTGSAAEYAMRGKRGVRVLMLSPYQKMSDFQTAQMFSLRTLMFLISPSKAYSTTARTWLRRSPMTWISRRVRRLARSIRSIGQGWSRKSSITLKAISLRPRHALKKSPLPFLLATSAIFAPATLPA